MVFNSGTLYLLEGYFCSIKTYSSRIKIIHKDKSIILAVCMIFPLITFHIFWCGKKFLFFYQWFNYFIGPILLFSFPMELIWLLQPCYSVSFLNNFRLNVCKLFFISSFLPYFNKFIASGYLLESTEQIFPDFSFF